ncbi:MAG: acetate--CoA ligase family protein [Deltaproteobacteria bacterium]|nr:acetate--CoA ligase family protein [Deltaproteobacteria bacterium]MCL5276833.1 acetate--CoA ligase family protein [Deltaproteobacteria bacterium]
MLDTIFKPSSIALIGASRVPGKVGYSLLKNIAGGGYRGKVYPVNPTASEILGITVYPDIKSIPGPIDLAVFMIPPRAIISSIKDCADRETKFAVVISAGFKEVGVEGALLEKQLKEQADAHGIRLVGPNCLGVIDTKARLNASFAADMPLAGDISILSQSGALLTAILDWALANDMGFSKFISLGNKADLNEADFIEYLADDPDTRVVLGYIEGVSDGRAFIEKAYRASKKKPVILIKAGGTTVGARASSSHTGTLAGSDAAFDAAFKQSGVIRAHTIEELFDIGKLFESQPLPKEGGLAIVTNAGGPGIITADATERAGIRLAHPDDDSILALKKVLPPSAAFGNPFDIIGDALADRYKSALDILVKDRDVSGILVLLTPQDMTEIDRTAQTVVDVSNGDARRLGRTVIGGFMGGKDIASGIRILNSGKVPNYVFPESAIRAYRVAMNYRDWLSKPEKTYRHYDIDLGKVRQSLDTVRASGRSSLVDVEARQIVELYGFRTPKSMLAHTMEEADAYAASIGYPVVMKIASPDILHKTDVGGVAVGIKDVEGLEASFSSITNNARKFMPAARIWGVVIQEMLDRGIETIVGMHIDPNFGPLVMFGLGGIYVEVLRDVSFRVAPVSEAEAHEMIQEIRSYPLLLGVRGAKKMDIPAIADGIMRVSQLVIDNPDAAELDINPLLVQEEGLGAVAVDARIAIKH